MASSLVDNMATDFAPDKFSDEYQDQLKKLIAAKLEQGDKLDTAATFGNEGEKADQAEVIDLMEALRQSVERNRAARAGGGGSDSKAPAKKSATKKAPAKKSAAKKSPAKKKAAKKAS
jgi:DNA end-binding protein Ku